MKNKIVKPIYITKEVIKNEIIDNTDDVLKTEFGYDFNDDNSIDYFNEIEKNNAGVRYMACSDLVNIDTAIKALTNLKNSNANHVAIEFDEDHYEYTLTGFNVRFSTTEERNNYKKEKQVEEKNRRKILKLQNEINKIKK